MSAFVAGATVVGAVVTADSQRKAAHTAADAQNQATAAAESASDQQLALAREQWDYQKNTLLPKQVQLADQQAALSQKVADQQLADSAYYRDLAGQNFDQAKKSWKYQDAFMGMADDYLNGNTANRMADEANADVQQAYGQGLQTMMRNADRYGINPGSGAFAATMGDMATQQAADAAGAQTRARTAARDKAEQMVAIAAGSGQAGFGTGLNAGSLGVNAGSAAVGSGASGAGTLNSTANSYNYGAGSALGSMGNAAANLGRLQWATPPNYLGDFVTGVGTGLARSGGFKMPSFNWPSFGGLFGGGSGVGFGDGTETVAGGGFVPY